MDPEAMEDGYRMLKEMKKATDSSSRAREPKKKSGMSEEER
jgi:hypothetical protein